MAQEKENKVWVDEGGMIYIEVAKTITEQGVDKLIGEVRGALEKLLGKAKLLIDMNDVRIIRSSQFRQKAAGQLRDMVENPGFEKAALFGGGLTRRTVASFIVAASGIKNMKVFETKEEALKWLKQP